MPKTKQNYLHLLILTGAALVIGLSVGAITAVFGRVLIALTTFRELHNTYLIPFLALSGLLIVYAYKQYGKHTDQGMGLVFQAAHGEAKDIPIRMIPLVIGGTWLTHLFGGSAGREGVAVQIGGVVGHALRRFVPAPDAGRLLLTAGMAAGFGGLFQTPMAGMFFALEVLVTGRLETRAVLPVTVAAFTASFTSRTLGLEKFTALINVPEMMSLAVIGKIGLLGIVFGLAGGAFAFLLKRTKAWAASQFTNPYVRIFIIGLAVSVLLLILHTGRYAGLGTNLISASFTGDMILPYDWLLKLTLTILTLSAGFQGGEVTPLFAIGATLGIALAPIIGLPLLFVAALGYISVFAAATNTLLAPIFIGAEVFGFAALPFYFIVVIVAYTFNGNQTIYTKQKELSWSA